MATYSISIVCDKCGEKSGTYEFDTTQQYVTIDLFAIRKLVRYENGECMMCRYKLKKWVEMKYV